MNFVDSCHVGLQKWEELQPFPRRHLSSEVSKISINIIGNHNVRVCSICVPFDALANMIPIIYWHSSKSHHYLSYLQHPKNRTISSVTEFDGKIYVFIVVSNYSNLKPVEFGFYSYDPALDKWTQKRHIDGRITLFKAKGQIYAFELNGTVHLYDVQNDTWQKVYLQKTPWCLQFNFTDNLSLSGRSSSTRRGSQTRG